MSRGVNVPVARGNLQGVFSVVRSGGECLPFADGCFDLVLCRHGSIEPRETVRVAGSGGRFPTQQVIPDYLSELGEFFPEMRVYPNHFRAYCDGLREHGFVLENMQDWRAPARFKCLGHLVYPLAAAPWTVPAFSIEIYMEGLRRLQTAVDAGRPLEFTVGCYIIEGRMAAAP
jgi:hypothetical protein